ncbi:MAG: NAD-dependent epimerase/dehydratase family protein [Flavobacteriaceae bacterium]
MDKILISGASGFVGRNLISSIRSTMNQYNVSGVSRVASKDSNITYSNIDVEDFNDISVFIHLAAMASDVKSLSNREEYFKVNTDLTKMLFDLFLKSTCDTFVFMSSVKAVRDTFSGVLDESISPQPIGVYGESKLLAEEYILSKKIPLGKRVFILRPTMIHGTGNKGNLNFLVKLIRHGVPYPFGKYNTKKSFLSIDNLNFIIKEIILDKRIAGGVYNICDSEPLNMNEVITLIADSIDRNSRILNIPKFLISAIKYMGDKLKLPFNSTTVQKLTSTYIVSNKKIINVIGKELPYTSRQGLIKTLTSLI